MGGKARRSLGYARPGRRGRAKFRRSGRADHRAGPGDQRGGPARQRPTGPAATAAPHHPAPPGCGPAPAPEGVRPDDRQDLHHTGRQDLSPVDVPHPDLSQLRSRPRGRHPRRRGQLRLPAGGPRRAALRGAVRPVHPEPAPVPRLRRSVLCRGRATTAARASYPSRDARPSPRPSARLCAKSAAPRRSQETRRNAVNKVHDPTSLWHVCGTRRSRSPHPKGTGSQETAPELGRSMRAGDGNRTRMTSLEGWGSTIELRPRNGGRTRRSCRAVTG